MDGFIAEKNALCGIYGAGQCTENLKEPKKKKMSALIT